MSKPLLEETGSEYEDVVYLSKVRAFSKAVKIFQLLLPEKRFSLKKSGKY